MAILAQACGLLPLSPSLHSLFFFLHVLATLRGRPGLRARSSVLPCFCFFAACAGCPQGYPGPPGQELSASMPPLFSCTCRPPSGVARAPGPEDDPPCLEFAACMCRLPPGSPGPRPEAPCLHAPSLPQVQATPGWPGPQGLRTYPPCCSLRRMCKRCRDFRGHEIPERIMTNVKIAPRN